MPFLSVYNQGRIYRQERLVNLHCGLRGCVCVPRRPQCRCPHTELPHFIQHYKHYASSVIEDVVCSFSVKSFPSMPRLL
ncbi:DUF6431 domain-containing protein [Anaerobutyricum hallii]|uniref:DUF6431 domain-containing protein n=1 Tax=Anaerobutyricum hallii TaxID=39488 RepID=UPI003FA489E5